MRERERERERERGVWIQERREWRIKGKKRQKERGEKVVVGGGVGRVDGRKSNVLIIVEVEGNGVSIRSLIIYANE